MIRPRQPAGAVTVDEFYDTIQDGQKADLIDGVIYMASPESLDADDLHGLIETLMRGYTKARHIGGRVCGSRVAFILDDRHAPEPDVAFMTPERFAAQRGKRVNGPPDLAIEITCDESRERDYDVKKRLYERAGVTEYWIIDLERSHVEFWILQAGRYVPLELQDGHIYRSTVIPGFWLDARWLTADPLPNDYDCLQSILKE